MLPNEQMFSVNLKNTKVKKGVKYSLCIIGMNYNGEDVKIALTQQQILGESMPLFINGKEQNNNLYFRIRSARIKKLSNITFKTLDSPDSKIINILLEDNEIQNSNKILRITVKNTGNSEWSDTNDVRIVVGDNDMGAKNIGKFRGFIASGATVMPGEEYTFRINLDSQFLGEIGGDMKLDVIMVKEGVMWFGERQTFSP